jgi:putative transposase
MYYTLEFKKNIVEKYQQKIPVTKLSREYEIPRSSIYNWIDLYLDKPIEEINVSKKKYKSLITKFNRMKVEHKLMKKILASLDLSKSERLYCAKQLHQKGYSVHMVCRLLGINRSTFYHDKFRKPAVKLIEQDDQKFKPVISRLFEDTDGRLGARKIRTLMMKEKYQISERRVKRLMNEMSLVPNKPDDDYNNYHKRKYSYKPNIISKSEFYSKPNKIWVSDITYIRVQREHYYFFVIIDLYSRKVIGHKLTKSLEAIELVKLMKTTYVSRQKPKNLIFHSDQGLQYTSLIFKKYLQKNEIEQSFSKKACPYDNSVAESFFASLKKEEIYRHIYNSFDHLKDSID